VVSLPTCTHSGGDALGLEASEHVGDMGGHGLLQTLDIEVFPGLGGGLVSGVGPCVGKMEIYHQAHPELVGGDVP